LVLGAFIYLLRKKQEAENELRKQQIQDVKESIKRAQADADAALRKIESTINQHLSHQTMCVSRFVSNDVYKQDMETQSSHVASMKGTIDTLNQIMVHQQTLVVQLVKTLP
jgi:Tfp pilus assembly protein PilX